MRYKSNFLFGLRLKVHGTWYLEVGGEVTPTIASYVRQGFNLITGPLAQRGRFNPALQE